MSILGKHWILQGEDLSSLTTRNLDDESVVFHNPFLFEGMGNAVKRIEQAIESDERILIFGDYDVDGISGTSILVHALRAMGANVSYRLPDRNDGYGLNEKWIHQFAELGIDVLITVDCGISNAAEIELSKKLDIDVIVTDHHTLPKTMPDAATAILHPALPNSQYPFKELAGSGMAFKFTIGIIQHLKGPEIAAEWTEKLVDLASLGTVADCVPLTGENRWIVRHGLDQMKRTEWEGLKTLLDIAEVRNIEGYPADVIGFRIGPRLNASGRMETPYFALQTLLNENGKARSLAKKLEALNSERRTLMDHAIADAEEQLRGHTDKKILIAWSRDWPAGIIGLIAGRLAEKYHRPTIIMEDRGDELIGSCRSIEGFNMVDALTNASECFKTFGGHAMAAGFTLPTENLPHFLEKTEVYAERLTAEELMPKLTIDFEVTLTDLTFELADAVVNLEPFGTGNSRPRFIVKKVKPTELQTVGREHRHLKFNVLQGRDSASAIAFRFGDHFETLQRAILRGNPEIDVVFELEKNVWNGQTRLQLKVVDLKIR